MQHYRSRGRYWGHLTYGPWPAGGRDWWGFEHHGKYAGPVWPLWLARAGVSRLPYNPRCWPLNLSVMRTRGEKSCRCGSL